MADIGHNSGTSNVGGIAGDRLKSFIERIERLEEERTAIAGDIREVYAEAKAVGFDNKVMRQVVKLRKMDRQDREEQDQLLDLYLHAIGFDTTPLGSAASATMQDGTTVTIDTNPGQTKEPDDE